MVDAAPSARLAAVARGTVPLLLALLLVMVASVPLRIPDFAVVAPVLSMMAVYYWTIYRPDLLPGPAAFLIGLVQDALGGGPLGQMALVLVLVHAATLTQRHVFVGKSYLVVWFGFTVISAGALALNWLLAMLLRGALIDPMPALYQSLLTIVLYPCFGSLFAWTRRRVLGGT